MEIFFSPLFFSSFGVRETIVHAGAPYRLALTTGGSDNSYDNYVLLDHIPHCDGCGAGLYSVEVVIPNWRCTDCALQLIQIMTDKFPASTSCANPQGLASSCGSQDHAYFSCANIHITGTEEDRIPFYVSYSGRRGFANRFPYSPGEKNDTAWVLQSTGEWKLLFEAPTGPTASEVPGTNRFYQGLAVWIVVFLIVIASFVVFMVLRHYAKSHAGTSYDNAQADLTQSTEDSEVVVTEPEEENGVKSPSTASTASTPSSNPFGDDSEAVEL